MGLWQRNLHSIEEADLQELVESGVDEGIHLDFKRQPPPTGEARDLVEDIASFANAAGGDLIFGIEERGGVAVRVSGLGDCDYEREIQRLEQIARSHLDPPVYGIVAMRIPLIVGGSVLILRIPRSWNGPHMVKSTAQSSRRGFPRSVYFARTSNGKVSMDASQIRGAFLQASEFARTAREFRLERLGRLVADEGPVGRMGRPLLLAHVYPSHGGNCASLSQMDTSIFRGVLSAAGDACPLWLGLNFDGVFLWHRLNDDPLQSTYVQFFRNGAVEIGSSMHLSMGQNRLRHHGVERALVPAIASTLSVIRNMEALPPIAVMYSLVGVRSYRLLRDERRTSDEIDRDDLLVPEVMLSAFDENLSSVLKPVFDAVWNAGGLPGSVNYHNGVWIQPEP